MIRKMLLPVVVLMLGIAAIAATTVLEGHAAASRSAAQRLATVKTNLISLQAIPQTSNPATGGSLASATQAMRDATLELDRQVAELERKSPPASLRKLPPALKANYARLEPMLSLLAGAVPSPTTGSTSVPPLNANAVRLIAGSESTFRTALHLLNDAHATYAGRAARADRESRVGAIGVIVLLLVAFLVLYLQNYRQHNRLLGTSRREALSDPLTGLANRRALTRDLEAALSTASSERPVTLALFDLDGFKQYNDTFGHPAGDGLLARLGTRLIAATAETASAYRIGGDEFCVLASRVPAGHDLLAACTTALSESGEKFTITCSHGVATAPSEAETAEQVLRLADQRLYEEKAARRTGNREVIDVLQSLMSERDLAFEEHLTTVASNARLTAQQLELHSKEVDRIQLAATLHDLGKTAVPDSLLNKPGPLSPEEWQFMRTHTLIGERIILAAPSLAHVAELVRSSHERLDGKGYPDGLAGDGIPLGSRIIAVCDAFDAMTRDRPYSMAVTPAQALSELRGAAGTQFDPRVVAAFCDLAAAKPTQLTLTTSSLIPRAA
jgi:diguanylate cyclase (GGDEF)-like protein